MTPYDVDGEIPPLPPNASRPPTTDDGSYRLGFLGEGDFRLEFADCRYFAYETKFWRSSLSLADGETITVPLGWEVGGIDVSPDLQPGATRPIPQPPTDPGELPFTGPSSLYSIWIIVAGALVLGGSILLRKAGTSAGP